MYKSIKLISLLTGMTLLSACAVQSATQVKTFTNASSDLVIETQDLMNELDDSTIDRKLYLLATDENKISSSLSIEDLQKIRGIYSTPQGQKAPVMKALSALYQYSESLGMLSTAMLREDIDQAAQNLYGSFNSMGTQYQKLTRKSLQRNEKALGVITTLIDGIGVVIVEQKRRKAIKEIVINSDPYVALLADAIYDKIGQNIDVLKLNYRQILNERIVSFRKRALKMKIETRVKKLRELKMETDYLDSIDAIYATAKQAVLALKKAHAVLRDTVSQDKFSSAQLSQAIGDINSLKKHMKSFSRAL
ncbi:MAG TPA: hypothetical protein ENI64_11440 [Gammaproteobacteria bacterium]|nr:hypothetical protein [Gammaproteobacteria bacterium]